MSFDDNIEYIESFVDNEKISYPNSYPPNQKINIIPKEDSSIYTDKYNNDKDSISYLNSKMTKNNPHDSGLLAQEDLTDEKKLFLIDEESKIDQIYFLKNDFSILFKSQKEKDKGNDNKKIKKLLGYKIDRNEENNEKHDKFSDDVIRRKCKYLVIKNLFEFLNNKIKNIYKDKLGHSIFKKELKRINQNQISNTSIDFNKNFLTKKICDIFSEDITSKYTNFPPNHNKNLINKLMNESDENKRIYFQKLFNLNFIQCLKHFNGTEPNILLKGLKCFKDLKNDIINKYEEEEGNEYFNILEYYLLNFEDIMNNKRTRNSRK